jgi:uncharacterized repeat protein (TIGR03803 family)
MSGLSFWKRIGLVGVFCAVSAISSPAQTLTTLYSFNNTDGSLPYAGLVQGTDGNFYGTTQVGGDPSCNGGYGCGTVFKITSGGTLTTLYTFCAKTNCTDGSRPQAGLVQGTDGNFYGSIQEGGANPTGCGGYGCGTVFKITAGGTLTTIYSFCSQTNCTDGYAPQAGLVQATDGNFYGTTVEGGDPSCNDGYGCGTVFKITPGGTLTTLHSFDGTDGENLYAGLVQGTDGNFYGTTTYGGAYGYWYGTVFKITPAGVLATLHSFDGNDGEVPYAGVVQATDGNFYGTTYSGGAYRDYGTVFKITPAGALKRLYSFCSQTGCPDGYWPDALLVQATDGNLYGTTLGGGANPTGCGGNGCGTVFKITPGGTLTTLYSFCAQTGCTDGAGPLAGLAQATDGSFYGTTRGGGTHGWGTVFSLSVGLGPFVETNPTSGKVGGKVIILGTNLTGATSVTFNGTPGTFTVNPTGTAIKTTVPSGATTGPVQVVTPGGTLTSNVNFHVRP